MMLNDFRGIKNTKTKKIHYSPIIYEFMNVCQGRPEYRSFCLLLDNGCSSTIVNRQRTKNIKNKYTHVNYTKWSTQAGNGKNIFILNFIKCDRNVYVEISHE